MMGGAGAAGEGSAVLSWRPGDYRIRWVQVSKEPSVSDYMTQGLRVCLEIVSVL